MSWIVLLIVLVFFGENRSTCRLNSCIPINAVVIIAVAIALVFLGDVVIVALCATYAVVCLIWLLQKCFAVAVVAVATTFLASVVLVFYGDVVVVILVIFSFLFFLGNIFATAVFDVLDVLAFLKDVR